MDDHLDGRALEAVGLPQAVLDVPLVGEVEQLRRVAEQDEGGGSHLGLGHVVDLESLALVRGRLDAHHGLTQHVVEGARGDTEVGLLVDRLDQIIQAVDALTRLGGDEGDGGVGHVGQAESHR